MEHSKFGAFTIQCNKCSRGSSLSEEDFKKDILTCSDPDCRSQFSIYEGIKNGLKKVEDHISPNFFLANEMITHHIEVKVGYAQSVNFPEGVKKVYKVLLIPTGNFLAGAVDITTNGFHLFTSIADNGDENIVGQTHSVIVMAHFKANDYDIPWLHMLQYAFEQLRDGEYLTSILFSEIAFEIYVDSSLTNGYKDMGLDEDSIKRMLTATEMPVKVNPLMNNVFGVKLASSSAWGDWEKKALKWRNDIAHGTKTTATKDEANMVYNTVVDSLFYFIEGIDNYLKNKGFTSGVFFDKE